MQPVLTKNERVLWLTVIERAMHDATERQPSVRQAAIDWIMRDQVDFPTVCSECGPRLRVPAKEAKAVLRA